jgi:ABC-type multidrug transport system fused ATPase/permease subunit
LDAIALARSALKAGATLAEAAATKTATGAQVGLNAALLACPVTWIIGLIILAIAVFYGAIAAINHFAGTSISATGVIFGAFLWLLSVVGNILFGLLELVFGVVNYMFNPFIEFANFLANVFTNPISSIIYLFQGMADNVLSILQKIASALDFVFGFSMANTVAGWRSGLREMADAAVAEYAPNENYTRVMDSLDLSVESTLGLQRFDNTDAWDVGYTAGENLESSIANFDPASLFGIDIPNADDYANSYDPSNMASDVANINSNTSDMASIGEEDLKYLRDIAQREAINRFTTAEVSIDFGGITNNVNNDMDLDGIVEYISDKTSDALLEVANLSIY